MYTVIAVLSLRGRIALAFNVLNISRVNKCFDIYAMIFQVVYVGTQPKKYFTRVQMTNPSFYGTLEVRKERL